jgi:hypothetical protein
MGADLYAISADVFAWLTVCAGMGGTTKRLERTRVLSEVPFQLLYLIASHALLNICGCWKLSGTEGRRSFTKLLRNFGSVSKYWRTVAKELMGNLSNVWLTVSAPGDYCVSECIKAFPYARGIRFRGEAELSHIAVALIRSSAIRLDASANLFTHGFDVLETLDCLCDLNLSRTQIADVNYLSSLVQLRTLRMTRTSVTNVDGLSVLTNLRLLHLDQTEVSDISALSSLVHLRTLNLASTRELQDIAVLSSLTKLHDLDLADTGILGIGALSALVSLRFLDLRFTDIPDLAPLASLVELQELNLASATFVTSAYPLSSLVMLRFLDIGRTRITNVSPLAGLVHLQTLALGCTRVERLAELSSLTNLRMLDIGTTEVADAALVHDPSSRYSSALVARQPAHAEPSSHGRQRYTTALGPDQSRNSGPLLPGQPARTAILAVIVQWCTIGRGFRPVAASANRLASIRAVAESLTGTCRLRLTLPTLDIKLAESDVRQSGASASV